MLTYENWQANYEVIKELCMKHRKELTAIGGVVGEAYGVLDCHEYIKFMNEMTMETFIGNYFTSLGNSYAIDLYKEILNGDKDIECLLDGNNDEVINTYEKLINEEES